MYGGHRTYRDAHGVWRMSGTRKPVKKAVVNCKRCLKTMKFGDPDPCLGVLPGVAYACCGHGVEEGYIYFHSGVVIRGEFTEIEKTKKPGEGMHNLTPVLEEHQNAEDG